YHVMLLSHNPSLSRILMIMMLFMFYISLLFLLTPLARSQQHDMHNMPGMKMNVPAAPEDPAQAAKLLANKQESEFNHHLAGLFVILAGAFILGEPPRHPFAGGALCLVYLLSGG